METNRNELLDLIRLLLSREIHKAIICSSLLSSRELIVPSELEKVTGYKATYVRRTLHELEGKGIVRKFGFHPITQERVYVFTNDVKILRNEIIQICKEITTEEVRKFSHIEDIEHNIRHNELVRLLEIIGIELGYEVKREFSDPEGLYRYDVAWFKHPRQVPVKIFEVIVHGDVDRALARFKHAIDIWGPGIDLFLIVAFDKHYERVEKLLGKLLGGTFHELEGKVKLVKASLIEELSKKHELLNLIKTLFT